MSVPRRQHSWSRTPLLFLDVVENNSLRDIATADALQAIAGLGLESFAEMFPRADMAGIHALRTGELFSRHHRGKFERH